MQMLCAVMLWQLVVETACMSIRGIDRQHVMAGPLNSGQQSETMN